MSSKSSTPFARIPLFAPLFIILNLRGFTVKFLFLTVISMAGTGSAFIFVYLLGDIVSNSANLSPDRLKYFYIPLFVAAILIKELFDYFLRRYGEPLSTVYVDRIRLRFLTHLLDSSTNSTQSISPHRSLSILDKYLGNVRESMDEWLWNGSRKLVQLIISLGILYFQSPTVLVANLIYFLIFGSLTLVISKRYLPYARNFAQADINASSNINSFAFHLPAILKIGARPFFNSSYNRSAQLRSEAIFNLKKFHANRWFIQLTIFYLGYIATLIYGAWQVQSGALALGFLVLIKYAFDLLNGVIIYISEYSVALVRQRSDGELIRKELGSLTILDRSADSPLTFQKFLHIHNAKCKFISQDGAEKRVEIPNFSISRLEKVGVMGPSGIGKSTLLSLIAGLLSAEGEIFIDDGRYSLGSFSIAGTTIVSPNDPLFNTTILENLTLGRDLSLHEIQTVLAAVCADDFLVDLNAVYGSEAVHFSTGQLQRLRLARALLTKPELLLLDEPFTGIDKITREKILRNLAPLLSRTTVVLVTHDREDLTLTERLYQFEEGRLIEAKSNR